MTNVRIPCRATLRMNPVIMTYILIRNLGLSIRLTEPDRRHVNIVNFSVSLHVRVNDLDQVKKEEADSTSLGRVAFTKQNVPRKQTDEKHFWLNAYR